MRLYSSSTGTTYLREIHADIPSDAVPISEARYQEVIANPAPGKVRSHDADGLPILVDPIPEVVVVTNAEVEAARLKAYADPLTGSDRFFSEALRESALGNAEAAQVAREAGLARYAAIQAELPWPSIRPGPGESGPTLEGEINTAG